MQMDRQARISVTPIIGGHLESAIAKLFNDFEG